MSEYKFGDDFYTEDDVKKRAQEKGLTIEEYLAQTPEVQKVKGLFDDVSESIDVHDWLRDDKKAQEFFNLEDEAAKIELEQRYRGFTFEEDFFMKTDRGGSFATIKATSPDKSESINIELNIDAVFGQLGEADKEYYNKESEKLISFIDKHYTEKEKKQFQEGRVQRAKFRAGVNKVTQLTKQESDDLSNKFSSVDMFDPVERQVGSGASSMTMGAGGTTTVIVQPYKEELTATYKELLNSEDTEISDLMKDPSRKDEAELLAKEETLIKLKAKSESSIQENKVKEILEDAEKGKLNPLIEEFWDPNIDPENIKGFLTVGDQEFVEDLAAKSSLVYAKDADISKRKVELDKYARNFQDEGFKFEVKEDEETVKLKDGRIMSKREFDYISQATKEYNASIDERNNAIISYGEEIDKLDNVVDRLDMYRKNYNDLSKTGVKLGAAFVDFYAKMTMGSYEDPSVQKDLESVLAMTEGWRRNYKDRVEFKDAFSSIGNFTEYMVSDMLTDQAPILLSLSQPGGISYLGASVFGGKYSEMTLDDMKQEAGAEAFGIDFEKKAVWEKALTAAGYTIPEVTLDYLFTGARIRNIQSSTRSFSKRTIEDVSTREGLKKFVARSAYDVGVDSFGGGASEGATGIIQNAIDGRPLFENFGEQFFNGLVLDGSLSSTPHVKGLVLSSLSNNSRFQGIKELQKEINKYNKIKNSTISEKIKEFAETKALELTEQRDAEIADIESKVVGTNNNKGLSESAAKTFFNIIGKQESLRAQYQEVLNDETIPESQKTSILNSLKQEFNTYQGLSENIKEKNFSNKAEWEVYVSQNKEDAAKRIKAAKEQLNKENPDKEFDTETIKERARINFNVEKINQNIKLAEKNEILGDLVIVRNQEEFDALMAESIDPVIKEIEAKEIKSESDLKKLSDLKRTKDAFKNGDYGFNLNGKSVNIVPNMAADNRLEVATHELGHEFAAQAFGNNQALFSGMAQTILEWANNNDKALYNTLTARAERSGDKFINEEIIMNFFEEVAANRVDLKSSDNKGLLSLAGYSVSKIMKDKFNIDINLGGVDDSMKLMYTIANKIKQGKVTAKDIKEAVDSKSIKKLEKLGERINKEYLFALSEEATKFANKTQQKIDDLGNKYTRDQWVEYGADETLAEIYGDLEALIGSKAFMLERLPNFSKEDFISDTIAELFSHIRNFNIDKKKTDKGFGLSGWINSQLMNKIGNVLKKKTATTETFTVDEDAETFKEQVETEDALETFEEEDLSLEAQLRKKRQEERRAEKGLEAGVEYSEFRRALELAGQKGISETMKKVVMDKTLEVLSSTKYIDLDIATLEQTLQRDFEVALKKVIQDAMGVTGDYNGFLTKNMATILKYLDVSSLVAIERQVSADEKIMTRFVKRLTKVQDIQEAIDNGWLAHVEDPSQGPFLYEILSPSASEFIKFYNPPLKVDSPKKAKQWDALGAEAQQAIADNMNVSLEEARRRNVEVRSGLKGTRKDTLAERIGGQLAFDATMEILQSPAFAAIRSQLGKPVVPQAKIKEIARRIDRGIEVKFATKSGKRVTVNSQMAQLSLEYIDNAVSNNAKFIDAKAIDTSSYKLNEEMISASQAIAEAVLLEDKGYFADSFLKEEEDLREIVMSMVIRNNVSVFKNKKGKYRTLNYMMEKFVIDGLSSFVKSAGAMITPTPTDKGGAADVTIYVKRKLNKFNYGLEKKMGKARGPATTVRPKIDKNGNVTFWIKEGKGDKPFVSQDYTTNGEDAAMIDLMLSDAAQSIERLNKDFISKGAEPFAGWDKPLTKKQLKLFSPQNPVLYRANYSIYSGRTGYTTSSNWTSAKYDSKVKKTGAIDIGVQGVSLLNSTDPNVILDNDIIRQEFEMNGLEIPTLSESIPTTLRFDIKSGKITFKLEQDIDGSKMKKSAINFKNKLHRKIFAEGASKAVLARAKRDQGKTTDAAVKNARKTNNNTESVGMSAFDFDETLIIKGENFVTATKGEDVVKISSEKWPIEGPKLASEGYKFDFSDFVNVRGGVDGPLMKEFKKKLGKFGPENMYILTARPQESAKAIHGWLKSKGINIPLANITGLGNSTGEAKAMWMVQKFSEGYNDMYFVDDALPNVKAVKDVLSQLDVKSDVQQAKIKFASNMSSEFNSIVERSRGIPAEEVLSRAVSRKRGKNKNKFQIFIPPSADDFAGLMYYFLDKGKQGEQDFDFFKKALIEPFSRSYTELDASRQTVLNDYDKLTKNYREVYKKLNKTMPNSEFTYDNAIRVYLFNKHGHAIPGVSQEEIAQLVSRIHADMELLVYAETLDMLTKTETYVKPTETWTVESIPSDLKKVVEGIHRKQFLEEWVENKNEIFSEANLNKVEAAYGTTFRDALEDILYRMETGISRPQGKNRINNQWTNWLNNSVGAIMFFNSKSALLQTLSTVNYLNFEDNNFFKAAIAFANQKQYWSDFAFIFNSDFLKQRRSGVKTDVSTSEIASAVAGASNKAKAGIAYLLKIGFTPTQIADSFAISAGGAAFYRNRVKKYVKEGMAQQQAEEQAFVDFREVTEETQQSARPDRVSQQQTTNAGRFILAFQNAPMQFNRIIKKAALDLVNRRGNDKANVSRIVYYGAVQNFIFLAMQNALFALLPDSEEEEQELTGTYTMKELKAIRKEREKALRKKEKFQQAKYDRITNGMIDTILRGSGITGAVISTIKNVYLKFRSEQMKLTKKEKAAELGISVEQYLKENPEARGQYDKMAPLMEALQISPQIGSKWRKFSKGQNTYVYDRLAIDEMSKFNTKNPLWLATAPVVEGVTNVPLNRIISKINNLKEAANGQNEPWQRVAVGAGWSPWDVGIDTSKEAKEAIKAAKEKGKAKEERCRANTSKGTRCQNMTTNKSGLCYAHD